MTAAATRADCAPLVRRLRDLAGEFDATATYYARFSGGHNALLRDQAHRAAEQLRVVAHRVDRGEYSQGYGVVWLRAAWRIITAIGRENLR